MNLQPAYGRDYKSKKEILADFNDNKDFIINDLFSKYDGKPVNRSQIEQEGITTVYIRYSGNRKVAALSFKKGAWA